MHWKSLVPTTLLQHPDLEWEDLLGEGSQSHVFRVQWKKKPAVLKLQKKTEVSQQEPSIFFKEALFLAQLQKRISPEIYFSGLEEDRAYLIEELIEGISLERKLQEEKSFSPKEVLAIGFAMAEALKVLHQENILHRDLNPANWILDQRGNWKLIDFGLADRPHGAPNSQVLGSLPYLSPEQTGLIQRSIDERSDLYSLGVILYECLFRTTPFQHKDRGQLLQMILNQVPPPPEPGSSLCPDGFWKLLACLMAKEPDDRYQSAAALKSDLLVCLEPQFNPRIGTRVEIRPRFVGREQAFDQLLHSWALAQESKGNCVWIEADSGMGKTRLIQEFELQIQARLHRRWLSGKSTQTEKPLPFSAFRELLRDFFDQLLNSSLGSEAKTEILKSLQFSQPAMDSLLPHMKTLWPASGNPSSSQLRYEQFFSLLSDFFVRLADLQQGLLIFIDDIQWLDEASQHLLQALGHKLRESKILLVLSCRNDEASKSVRSRMLKSMASHFSNRIELQALSEEETRELVAYQLKGLPIGPEIAPQIQHLSQGVPFAILQILDLMIRAGALRPENASWRLHEATTQKLQLPRNLIELVLRRLKLVAPETRDFLSYAALWGARFPLSVIGKAFEGSQSDFHSALQQAYEGGFILKSEEGEDAVFAHDRVQEAVEIQIGPEKRRRRHLRLAQALQELHLNEKLVYQWTLQLRLAGELADPEVLQTASLKSAEMALRESAIHKALDFFDWAELSTRKTGQTLPLAAQRDFALCCSVSGKHEEALNRFKAFLDQETDPVERAKAHYELGRIAIYRREIDKAWYHTNQGLTELGFWPRSSRLGRFFSAAFRTVWGVLIDLLGVDLRVPENSPEAEALKLTARFTEMGGVTAYFLNDSWRFAQIILPSIYVTIRLPECGEKALSQVAFATGVSVLGLQALANRFERKSSQSVRLVKDPYLTVRVALYRIFVLQFLNRWIEARHEVLSLIKTQGPYLDAQDMMNATCGGVTCMTMISGHQKEGEWAYEAAKQFLKQHESRTEYQSAHPFLSNGISVLTTAGALQEAQVQETEISRVIENNPSDALGRLGFYGSRLAACYDSQVIGKEIEELTKLGDSVSPRLVFLGMPHFRFFYVFSCYTRLNRCWMYRESDSLPQYLMDLKRRMRLFRWAQLMPAWKPASAHLWILKAAVALLEGQAQKSLELLLRAERLADKFDLPWVSFEALRWRAHALNALQHEEAARRTSMMALQLAQRQNWTQRVENLLREFKFHQSPLGVSQEEQGSTALLSSTLPLTQMNHLQQKRQFETLVRMSSSSSSLFQAQEQARHLLDEAVSYFGADRALLFLMDRHGGESHRPELFFGRSREGEDLKASTDHSHSALTQAIQKARPLITTIDHAAEDLGTQSVRAHNLRSVLAAPLMSRNQVLGVLYLDNKLIKGVFRESDREFIQSVAGVFAGALESARVANMELDQAALQRDLELTGVVQKFLLPQTSVIRSGALEIHGFLKPAADSSGDIWMVEELRPGLILIFIGDVTGHGPAPAMVTATVFGAFKHFVSQVKENAKNLDYNEAREQILGFLKRQDEILKAVAQTNYLMPFNCALISEEGRASLIGGGLPAQLLKRKQQDAAFFQLTGPLLGMGSNQEFEVQEVDQDLDQLFLFSDGLMEAIVSKRSPEMTLLRWVNQSPTPEILTEQLRKGLLEKAPDDVTYVQVWRRTQKTAKKAA